MGGKRIDDHSSWIGKGNKDSVFPMGCKCKNESSAEGAGSLSKYEDTTDEIKKSQDMGIAKVKAHAMKPNYRN
jgi:hypothetical protein